MPLLSWEHQALVTFFPAMLQPFEYDQPLAEPPPSHLSEDTVEDAIQDISRASNIHEFSSQQKALLNVWLYGGEEDEENDSMQDTDKLAATRGN